ncbi:HpcH/HpaI aldolase/citrate lyase family protein [Paralcaligenes ureilyticus]|uniref:Citrate lyase subunit beta/citryl-CoA lyase n=1 Tax=Paralcaligenes ureilyticus TaxID=627131 RepID=A0A4R3M816_9BURK|nr:CoA ester lyase [Paralcaligenes ureilyticus]TCT09634.1 citrate lyase subunit beta/citryl-CoA lyase [Paralcaligenes ureilyticus]
MNLRLRTLLYVPGINLRAMQKAVDLPVDAIIFDLEDSILESQKVQARITLKSFLAAPEKQATSPRTVIRINSVESSFWNDDLKLVKELRPQAVLLSKVANAKTIHLANEYLNGPGEQVKIWAMVENPLGILKLDQIVEDSLTKNLECLVLGTNDFVKDTDIDPGENRANLTPWFTRIIMVAKAYGLPVIDGVLNDIHDQNTLELESKAAKAMGMTGKTIIHPNQVDIVNSVFSPTPQELAWWTKIVDTYALPENANKGVINLDGIMVERLHLESAIRRLQLTAC